MIDILYEEDGAVARITLNRPEVLNAFNEAARVGFIEAMQRAADSKAARVVVLCGTGRGFSAGADLTEDLPPDGAATVLEKGYNPGILAIGQLPKPVIAAVHGFAVGIGVSYALACDLVVMGEQSYLQLPFAKIGLVPDGGLCWQLAQRIGHRLAFEMAVEGERIPAPRCLELGLANRVVAEERVLQEAQEWASRLALQAPVAMASTKQALRAAGAASLRDIMSLEAKLQRACLETADFREGVSAFFQKRPPRFTGA